MLINFLFSLVAGMLSVLSPCVLPVLPLVFGTAASIHRFGPAALALGLVSSYVAAGLLVATLGLGFDGDIVRKVAAAFLVGLGAVLLVPAAQRRVVLAAAPVAARLSDRFASWSPRSLAGQFGVGVLLGAMWSPCVGPTLGTAVMLAMQGRDLAGAAATMAVFGLGAAAPLLVLGWGGRAVLRWRGGLAVAGTWGRRALGASLLLAGGAVISGLDRHLEAAIVDASPDWLTQLTTRF